MEFMNIIITSPDPRGVKSFMPVWLQYSVSAYVLNAFLELNKYTSNRDPLEVFILEPNTVKLIETFKTRKTTCVNAL